MLVQMWDLMPEGESPWTEVQVLAVYVYVYVLTGYGELFFHCSSTSGG